MTAQKSLKQRKSLRQFGIKNSQTADSQNADGNLGFHFFER